MKKVFLVLIFGVHSLCFAEVKSPLALGKESLSQGKYNEAIIRFREVIETNSKDWQSWFFLGEAYSKVDLNNEAKECFQKVLFLKKDSAETYFNLGELFFREGFYSQAIENYRKSLELNPEEIENYLRLSECYKQSGEIKNAIVYLEKVIAIAPKKEYYHLLGWLYFRDRLYNLASETFTQALKLEPESYEIYLERAIIDLKLGNLEQALEETKRALRINSESALAYFLQALIYSQRKEKNIAFTAAEKALNLTKESSSLKNYITYFLVRGKR